MLFFYKIYLGYFIIPVVIFIFSVTLIIDSLKDKDRWIYPIHELKSINKENKQAIHFSYNC